LTAIEDDWEAYRRALRRRSQPHFDALFEAARRHADAAGNLNTHNPMHPVLLSMLLEQQRRIEALETRVTLLTTSVKDAAMDDVPDDQSES
jgi:Lon protease-like protein